MSDGSSSAAKTGDDHAQVRAVFETDAGTLQISVTPSGTWTVYASGSSGSRRVGQGGSMV